MIAKGDGAVAGVPQGGVASPVLSNIYLTVFDKRMAQAGFQLTRYADDWLIGFIGPKSEVEAIKHQLEEYLRDHLKLELSDTKTLITHARSECARFLGYEVQSLHNNTKRTHAKRCINGRIGLRVPHSVMQEKRQRYQRQGKPRHRPELMVESDFTIMAHYQAEYRGLVDYYRLAYNLPLRLQRPAHGGESPRQRRLPRRQAPRVGHQEHEDPQRAGRRALPQVARAPARVACASSR